MTDVVSLLLVLIGTVLLFLAGFGVASARVALGWLGLALIATAVWLLPALASVT